jgi:hypothetical protein
MGETKLRYKVVRVADSTDDQKTATEILNSLATSVTQENLQEFILSQIKRVIHGEGVGSWRDDFIGAGILSLFDLTQLIGTSGVSVPADCLSTDSIGDLVYISGNSIGGVLQVTKADILDYTKMPVIGSIVSKTSPTACRIIRYGIISVAGLSPGQIYFVDFNSKPTHTRPVAGVGQKAFVQVIGVAMDSTTMLFNPSSNLVRVIH